MRNSKIAIIGAGDVGSTFAYALLMKGSAREIALINRTREKAEGEVMDLNHGMSFVTPTTIRAGGYELCSDAQVVVITAGAAQDPGESRLELTQKNSRIMQKIVPRILEHNPSPILLMVTNPVDVLTYVALKESGLDSGHVLGAGTVLDTSRFRYLLSDQCEVDARNVHGYVIGEHGDTELALWSRVNIAGVPLDRYCQTCRKSCGAQGKEKIFEDVRNAAYRIIERKGSTYYAIGLALVKIVEAVLKNQRSVLTVSGMIDDYYGISDVCLSVPTLVGGSGREGIIRAEIADNEVKALQHSAEVLRKNIKSIGY